jgi:hypothetical protein
MGVNKPLDWGRTLAPIVPFWRHRKNSLTPSQSIDNEGKNLFPPDLTTAGAWLCDQGSPRKSA